MRVSRRLLAGGVSGLVLAGLIGAPAVAAPASAAEQTSAAEAARVDAVPTPELDWWACYDWAQCATVNLPLDYDNPKGKKIEVAVARVPARDQANKIGSLFVNPGGPGGPGTDMAIASPLWLSSEVRDKFDIVGFDPRGLAYSSEVKCFDSAKEQAEKLSGMNVFFPYGEEEEAAYIASARELGKACSTTGKPLSAAMSTAEVVRDMEVLRRAVGDDKLTYLGFSYGTAIGQYYANMFPDRFRAITVDGVINPESWVGDDSTKNKTLDDRLRSADGAYRALTEIFERCDAAGEELCPRAGHLGADFALIADRLKAEPLEMEDVFGTYLFRYSDLVGNALSMLYDMYGYEWLGFMVDDLMVLTDPESSAEQRTAARSRLVERLGPRDKWPGRDWPYFNGAEMGSAVICTDGVHPGDASRWPQLTAKADKRAPYFGRAWGWGDSMCARKTWTAKDEDAYKGPFNRNTAAPVLIVGNYWDPATNYDDAVSSAALLPNSRLLSSDSWGHTAYGSSECVTTAIDQYLLTAALPAEGTVCVGDVQPYQPEPEAAAKRSTGEQVKTERAPLDREETAKLNPSTAGEATMLPPVAALR